jgi:two-component system sensor histidine kinase/response regulator
MIPVNATMTGSYDYLEVARSILIAVAASYAALDLAGRVTAARGRARAAWLAGGAIAMGIGIWAMHFKGMLAFHLPVTVAYDWPTVLLSLLAGILSSAFALYVVSRQKMGLVRALTGTVIMGGGIAALHYVGMAAMRLAAVCRFNLRVVALSVVLAVIFSLIALLMAFGSRGETEGIVRRKLGSALMMGAAISAMHYTGMAAASFIPSMLPVDLSHAVSISSISNNGIAVVTFLVLGAAVLTSAVDRRFTAQAVEIRQLNEELEQRVTERTRELTAVNEELRKEITERQHAEEALHEAQGRLNHVTRMLAMGELVASIAHEINQPLTGIVINANFCLRHMAGSTTPNLDQLRGAVAEIVNDGARASEVISRIRALLKKDASARIDLDINEIIRETVVLVRREVTRNQVSLRIDLAPDLPGVLGDRVQLQQVLINLVMNAIDAMRAVMDRPRELLIKSANHADGVLVQVQDSGTGFDPEQVNRIFEPFFTTKHEGMGLGLSISRSIIESHGGRFWAESRSNGALFQFILFAQE